MIINKICNKFKDFFNPYKIFLTELKYVYKYKRDYRVRVLLLAHSLEKGMGVENIKANYGVQKANQLISLLDEMIKKDDANNFAFNEGYSVLKRWLEFKKDNNEEASKVKERFENLKIKDFTLYPAGYSIINKCDIENYTNIDFSNFIKTKHSMRKGAFEPITEEEINYVINIAKYAPSACNRQPCKIYFSTSIEKNKAISTLVPGNKSFQEDVPYYTILTADRKSFSAGESMQWYLNAGIFASYFTLALHSKNIGSCIFQFPAFYKTEKSIRKICKIDKAEVITCIIGMGKYPETFKIIEAFRKPNSEILSFF